MLKATILICSICAGAGGTAMWVNSGPTSPDIAAASAGMPSINELNVKANAAGMPDRTVKEAY
jgi:hypothetical protein